MTKEAESNLGVDVLKAIQSKGFDAQSGLLFFIDAEGRFHRVYINGISRSLLRWAHFALNEETFALTLDAHIQKSIETISDAILQKSKVGLQPSGLTNE